MGAAGSTAASLERRHQQQQLEVSKMKLMARRQQQSINNNNNPNNIAKPTRLYEPHPHPHQSQNANCGLASQSADPSLCPYSSNCDLNNNPISEQLINGHTRLPLSPSMAITCCQVQQQQQQHEPPPTKSSRPHPHHRLAPVQARIQHKYNNNNNDQLLLSRRLSDSLPSLVIMNQQQLELANELAANQTPTHCANLSSAKNKQTNRLQYEPPVGFYYEEELVSGTGTGIEPPANVQYHRQQHGNKQLVSHDLAESAARHCHQQANQINASKASKLASNYHQNVVSQPTSHPHSYAHLQQRPCTRAASLSCLHPSNAAHYPQPPKQQQACLYHNRASQSHSARSKPTAGYSDLEPAVANGSSQRHLLNLARQQQQQRPAQNINKYNKAKLRQQQQHQLQFQQQHAHLQRGEACPVLPALPRSQSLHELHVQLRATENGQRMRTTGTLRGGGAEPAAGSACSPPSHKVNQVTEQLDELRRARLQREASANRTTSKLDDDDHRASRVSAPNREQTAESQNEQQPRMANSQEDKQTTKNNDEKLNQMKRSLSHSILSRRQDPNGANEEHGVDDDEHDDLSELAQFLYQFEQRQRQLKMQQKEKQQQESDIDNKKSTTSKTTFNEKAAIENPIQMQELNKSPSSRDDESHRKPPLQNQGPTSSPNLNKSQSQQQQFHQHHQSPNSTTSSSGFASSNSVCSSSIGSKRSNAGAASSKKYPAPMPPAPQAANPPALKSTSSLLSIVGECEPEPTKHGQEQAERDNCGAPTHVQLEQLKRYSQLIERSQSELALNHLTSNSNVELLWLNSQSGQPKKKLGSRKLAAGSSNNGQRQSKASGPTSKIINLIRGKASSNSSSKSQTSTNSQMKNDNQRQQPSSWLLGNAKDKLLAKQQHRRNLISAAATPLESPKAGMKLAAGGRSLDVDCDCNCDSNQISANPNRCPSALICNINHHQDRASESMGEMRARSGAGAVRDNQQGGRVTSDARPIVFESIATDPSNRMDDQYCRENTVNERRESAVNSADGHPYARKLIHDQADSQKLITRSGNLNSNQNANANNNIKPSLLCNNESPQHGSSLKGSESLCDLNFDCDLELIKRCSVAADLLIERQQQQRPPTAAEHGPPADRSQPNKNYKQNLIGHLAVGKRPAGESKKFTKNSNSKKGTNNNHDDQSNSNRNNNKFLNQRAPTNNGSDDKNNNNNNDKENWRLVSNGFVPSHDQHPATHKTHNSNKLLASNQQQPANSNNSSKWSPANWLSRSSIENHAGNKSNNNKQKAQQQQLKSTSSSSPYSLAKLISTTSNQHHQHANGNYVNNLSTTVASSTNAALDYEASELLEALDQSLELECESLDQRAKLRSQQLANQALVESYWDMDTANFNIDALECYYENNNNNQLNAANRNAPATTNLPNNRKRLNGGDDDDDDDDEVNYASRELFYRALVEATFDVPASSREAARKNDQLHSTQAAGDLRSSPSNSFTYQQSAPKPTANSLIHPQLQLSTPTKTDEHQQVSRSQAAKSSSSSSSLSNAGVITHNNKIEHRPIEPTLLLSALVPTSNKNNNINHNKLAPAPKKLISSTPFKNILLAATRVSYGSSCSSSKNSTTTTTSGPCRLLAAPASIYSSKRSVSSPSSAASPMELDPSFILRRKTPNAGLRLGARC